MRVKMPKSYKFLTFWWLLMPAKNDPKTQNQNW